MKKSDCILGARTNPHSAGRAQAGPKRSAGANAAKQQAGRVGGSGAVALPARSRARPHPPVQPLRVVLVACETAIRRVLRKVPQVKRGSWSISSAGSDVRRCQDLARVPAGARAVLLLDMTLSGVAGAQNIWRLRALFPGAPIIALTASQDEGAFVAALVAGACSCLIEPVGPELLGGAITAAAAGRAVLGPRGQNRAVTALRSLLSPAAPVGELTRRECQVALCAAQEMPRKDIARQLNISSETVHIHLQHVFQKLGIHHASDVIAAR